MLHFAKMDLTRFRQAHELLTDADFEGPLYNAWKRQVDVTIGTRG